MDNAYDDEDEQTEAACELFKQYISLLNQEFHDHADAKKVGQECVIIAAQLLKLGFVIFANILPNTETITLSDDVTQTILIFTYELILIPNQIPIQEPVAFASAISRIFGPMTEEVHGEDAHPVISPQEETWLHSILDHLTIDKPNKNSPNEERS